MTANSHAGAQGLMQLMPYTAKLVSKQAKLPYSKSRLTTDPEYNINLGSHYIAGLILEYDGAYPFAIAAYNAGPKRVRYWKKKNKDPQKKQIALELKLAKQQVRVMQLNNIIETEQVVTQQTYLKFQTRQR